MTIASGSESQVNSTTTGNQTAPTVIALADGGYVVVWDTPAGWSLQAFDGDGATSGSEVMYTSPMPAVWAAMPDGRFAYAYHTSSPSTAYFGILNGDGSQSVATTNFFTSLYSGVPVTLALAVNPAGDILLAASSDMAVMGFRIATDGQRIGGNITIASADSAHQHQGATNVRLAIAPDGDFLAVYDRVGAGTQARYLNSDGTFGPEFDLPVPDDARVIHGDGKVYFAWIEEDQNGNPNVAVGTTDGSSFDAEWLDGVGTNPSDVKLWQLGDGRLLVTWTATSAGDGDGKSVMGQLVSLGLPIGEAFVINSSVTGDQTSVSVATMADGRFVATWQTPAIDGDGMGIAARTFDPRAYTSTDGDDLWIGGSFSETISGGEGNDTLGGEGGDDYITGDGGNDLLVDNDGRDTLEGGTGDDRFTVNLSGIVPGQNDIYDGGADIDTLRVLPEAGGGYVADLRAASILNFERLVFADPGEAGTGRIQLSASQIGAGLLSGNATIDAAGAEFFDTTEILEITLGVSTQVDLSGLSFVGWGGVNDHVEIVGDSDAETITGSTVSDWIVDGGGEDTVDSGAGDDTVFVWVADIVPGQNDIYDGGADTDTLRVLPEGPGYVADLRAVSILSFERLVFADPGEAGTGRIQLSAGQVGVGLLSGLATIDATGAGLSDTTEILEVTLGLSTGVDLSGLSFVGWGAVNDRVEIVGDGDGETITGSAVSDWIVGGDGNDTVAGMGGNDTIAGSGGNDKLNGGAGTDTADYSDKTKRVEVVLTAALASVVKVNGVAEDQISNIERVVGGGSHDSFIGDSLSNALVGNAGNDTFKGGAGKDTVDGGAGTDIADFSDKTTKVEVVLRGSTPVSVKVNNVVEDSLKNVENVAGGSAGDKLVGDDLGNLLIGNGGVDSLSGGVGNDVLKGGTGKDVLDGASGSGDRADYTDKTVAVVVTLKTSTTVTATVGGAAEDTIKNIEQVFGGSGADKLTGDSLANYFAGNSGNDSLVGNSGNDTLNGGHGSDTLDGGSGADRFIFNSALVSGGGDTIKVFERNVDKLHLDNAVFVALTGSTLASAAFYAASGAVKAHDSTDRIVYNKTNGRLYYDADGNKSGGVAALHFATLSNKPTLDHGDFLIV